MDKNISKPKQTISSTKRLVGTAVFSALSYVVSMLEFPIFPATPFLKLDFSAVFLLLSGFIFGTIYGIGACAIKELICFMTNLQFHHPRCRCAKLVGALANQAYA